MLSCSTPSSSLLLEHMCVHDVYATTGSLVFHHAVRFLGLMSSASTQTQASLAFPVDAVHYVDDPRFHSCGSAHCCLTPSLRLVGIMSCIWSLHSSHVLYRKCGVSSIVTSGLRSQDICTAPCLWSRLLPHAAKLVYDGTSSVSCRTCLKSARHRLWIQLHGLSWLVWLVTEALVPKSNDSTLNGMFSVSILHI